ncbi:MAG: hypothetical protein L6437_03335 [Kiritimatiellae bacterium]|nr:hypothetical protein [Kiritimatiellia bacterium]
MQRNRNTEEPGAGKLLARVCGSAGEETPGSTRTVKLVGQPIDLAPWAYAWRADREIQEKPEAYFIQRRMERLDKVFRPLVDTPEFKSLKRRDPPMLAPPKGRLWSALLWLAPLHHARIELRWPENGGEIPPPEAVEVRVYPALHGWFGPLWDEILRPPEVSPDRRTWAYLNENDPWTGKPMPVSPKATDMVAVFLDKSKAPTGAKYACPSIHLIGTRTWRKLDVEIEWGFQAGKEDAVCGGRIEAYVGMVGHVSPLAEDKGTTMTGACEWRSSGANGKRRGITASLVYDARPDRRNSSSHSCGPLDTRITIGSRNGSLTFLADDVNFGPILAPEHGIFVTKAGSGKTARQFAAELAAKNLKCVPQMTREHREAASWEELMREIRLTRGKAIPVLQPWEEPPTNAMRVHVPDERWADSWRRSSWELRTKNHCWEALATENALVIYGTDLVGHHDTSAKRLQYWLKAPGVAPDGDFVDGAGGFEYAKSMKHGIAWSHDGCHPATGLLLFTMAEHYFLSGDKEWFQQNRARMGAAADWIIRQRGRYKDIPNWKNLDVAGLQPPQVLADAYLPMSYWRWYLVHDAFSHQGLRRFADALAEFDPADARKYREEAEAYGKDILRVVERETAQAPVRPVRDGTYRGMIPASPYARGSKVAPEMLNRCYPMADIELGTLPLADSFGVLAANDTRVGSYLDVIEEALLRRENNPNVSAENSWFWNGFPAFVKCSFVCRIHLLRDDAPCFLRHFMNNYAAYVELHGGFRENWNLGGVRGPEDTGTTAWFMHTFRDMLVMEAGEVLWLARAAPRVWLEQDKKIAVTNAPTYFGALDYEIVSDVDNGKINATIEMPSRKAPKEVLLRLRHPKSAPIRGVTVNGTDWKDFDPAREVVKLRDLKDKVNVEVKY